MFKLSTYRLAHIVTVDEVFLPQNYGLDVYFVVLNLPNPDAHGVESPFIGSQAMWYISEGKIYLLCVPFVSFLIQTSAF